MPGPRFGPSCQTSRDDSDELMPTAMGFFPRRRLDYRPHGDRIVPQAAVMVPRGCRDRDPIFLQVANMLE